MHLSSCAAQHAQHSMHSTACTAQHSMHSIACIAHHVQLIVQAISAKRPLAAVSNHLEHDRGIACTLFQMTDSPSVKRSLILVTSVDVLLLQKEISMALK